MDLKNIRVYLKRGFLPISDGEWRVPQPDEIPKGLKQLAKFIQQELPTLNTPLDQLIAITSLKSIVSKTFANSISVQKIDRTFRQITSLKNDVAADLHTQLQILSATIQEMQILDRQPFAVKSLEMLEQLEMLTQIAEEQQGASSSENAFPFAPIFNQFTPQLLGRFDFAAIEQYSYIFIKARHLLPVELYHSLGREVLYHAFNRKNQDLVDKLLRNGIPIDFPNAEGRTLLDSEIAVYQSLGGSSNTSAAESSFLIALLNSYGETPDPLVLEWRTHFFQIALTNFDYPEIIKYLNVGILPNPEESIALAGRAMIHHQYFILEHLLEHGRLRIINVDLMSSLILNHITEWSLSFLLRAAESPGVVFEELHPLYIENFVTILQEQTHRQKRLPLAVTLTYLNIIPLEYFGAYQPVIAHFLSYLRDVPKEEVRFRLSLGLKNLAHLVGDSFIGKMVDDAGGMLEGGNSPVLIEFLDASMAFAGIKRPEIYDQLRTTLAMMEKARVLGWRLWGITCLDSPEKMAAALPLLEKELLIQIEALELNDSLLIPLGYSRGSGGHALALKCKKLPNNEIELNIINTGEGLTYHSSAHDSSRLHANTTKRHVIALDTLIDNHVIQSLLEIRTVSRLSQSTWVSDYSDKDVYGLLSPYAKTEDQPIDELPDNWRKAQLNGTCTLRCLLAYLKTVMGTKSYKETMDDIKESSVIFAVEQYQPLSTTEKQTRKFLSFSLPNVIDTINKRLKSNAYQSPDEAEAKLIRLKTASELLTSALPRAESSEDSISADILSSVQPIQLSFTADPQIDNSSILNALQFVVNTVRSVNSFIRPKTYPAQLYNTNKITTAYDLEKALSSLVKYMNREDKEASGPVAIMFIRELGRLLLDIDSRPINGEQLQLSLEKNPHMCRNILNLLNTVSTHIVPENNAYFDPQIDVAIYYTFAVAWELALIIEKTLPRLPESSLIRSYGFKYNDLGKSRDGYEFLSPALEYDMKVLQKFGWGSNSTQKRSTLFPRSTRMKRIGSLEGTELDYIKGLPLDSQALGITEKDILSKSDANRQRKRAQLDLERDKKSFRSRHGSELDVDYEDWEPYWKLVKEQLPPYFVILRSLAYRAMIYETYYVPEAVSTAGVWTPDRVTITGSKQNGKNLVSYRRHQDEQYPSIIFKSRSFENSYKKLLSNILWRETKDFRETEIQISRVLNLETRTLLKIHAQRDAPEVSLSYLSSNEASTSADLSITPSNAPGLVVALPLLLSHFGNNLERLRDDTVMLYFETTMFGMGHLPLMIEKQPHIIETVNLFFEKAFNHFECQFKTNYQLKSNLTVLTFLLIQKERYLSTLLLCGVPRVGEITVEEALSATREKILELSNAQVPDSLDILKFLHLAYIDSFQATPPQNLRDVENLIHSILTVRIIKDEIPNASDTCGSRELESCLQIIPYAYTGILMTMLRDHPADRNLILSKAVKIIISGFSIETSWKESLFPEYTARAPDGSVFKLNILTGSLLINDTKTDKINKAIAADATYKELYGDTIIHVLNKSFCSYNDDLIERYTCYDEDGIVEIYAGGVVHEVRRQFDGIPYGYVPSSSHEGIPSLFRSEDSLLWRSREDNPRYLAIDKKTKQHVIATDDHGRVIFLRDSPTKQYEFCNVREIPGGSRIFTLDPNASLLKEVSGTAPDELRLNIPNIRLEGNRPLEFFRKIPKGSLRPRWALNDQPHLYLADEQILPSIHGYKAFLILESATGVKEALIPYRLENDPKKKYPCIRVPIKGEKLHTQSPEENIYIAYLALLHASTPADYETVMYYLKGGYKFEAYTNAEITLIKTLFLSYKNTKDNVGSAVACRLYAAWLVQDNLRRNPADSRNISRTDNTKNTPNIWLDRTTGEKSIEDYIGKAFQLYFQQRSHIPPSLRIENLIDSLELKEWQLRVKKVSSGSTKTLFKEYFRFNIGITQAQVFVSFLVNSGVPATTPNLLTRPSTAIQSNFRQLLFYALSDNSVWRQRVFDIIIRTFHDKNPGNQFLIILLHAALHSEENLRAEEITKTTQLVLSQTPMTPSAVNIFFNLCQSYSKLMTLEELSQGPGSIPLIPTAKTLPENESRPLPDNIPQIARVKYRATRVPNSIFSSLFKGAFELAPKKETDVELFEAPNEELQDAITELNDDYLRGVEKNREIPQYKLKDSYPIKTLLAKSRRFKTTANQLQNEQLPLKQEKILKLANTLPSDPNKSLGVRGKRISERKPPLTLQDCVGLFLQGDYDNYKRITHLEDPKQIAKLHQRIGEYITLHNYTQRCVAVHQAFETLKQTLKLEDNDAVSRVENALQKLAEELNQFSVVDSKIDPAALLVFEYALGITLKEHQVQGLRDMLQTDPENPTKFRNILLQRIQGGGKSLVFGHLLALLKADGYHLSMHIPATAQYKTALYDMRERSRQLFGQRERTLVFDDDPLKFTPEYLEHVRDTLEEIILNREYLTITIESLRALRCKYLKSYFLLLENPHDSRLIKSHEFLNDILSIIRTRGALTFDEVHLALDPQQELNMPFGSSLPPKHSHSVLIGQIIQIASQTTDEEGNPLLTIKNSQEQSPEQYALMKDSILRQLLTFYPSWNNEEILDYILGLNPDLPAALEDPIRQEEGSLVILLRQMLVGDGESEPWLKLALQMKINENHGLTDTEKLRVSIPYIANMRPAWGSEYSDAVVIVTNTLIAYLSTGLSALQAREFISRYQQQAQKELKHQESEGIFSGDTPTTRLFFEAFLQPLNAFDPDNSASVEELVQLLIPTPQNILSNAAIELMFDYVINCELSKVQIFHHQTTSNGQNTASMGQSSDGYSGSIENLNMAPIGTEVQLEKGTNGQTMDLLILYGTEVVITGQTAEALFVDLIDSHALKALIRAIIDVGAHFRGTDNETVAEMVCNRLPSMKSKAKGVLFFSTQTGQLCFMDRKHPGTVKILSGTNRETILNETGFDSTLLFTYYDQEHITGIDIAQDPNAIAILTISETTELFQVAQGTRRFRDVDGNQRIVVSIARNVIPVLNRLLGRLHANPNECNIRDVILFTKIVSTLPVKDKNLQLALQKMTDYVEQFVLDHLYQLPFNERMGLFSTIGSLFDKNNLVDLFREYAHKRQMIDTLSYFEGFLNSLLEPLVNAFPEEEIEQLKTDFKNHIMNETTYAELNPKQSIPHISEKGSIAATVSRNRQATRILHQEQNNEQQQKLEQVNKIKHLQNISQSSNMRVKRGREEDFIGTSILVESSENVGASSSNQTFSPYWWSLNEAFRRGLPDTPTEILFDPELNISINAAKIEAHFDGLLGVERNAPWPILLICDRIGKEDYFKAVIITPEDVRSFHAALTKEPQKLPANRQVWMFSTDGKLIFGNSIAAENAMESPKVTKLFVQSQFFAGANEVLNVSPWFEHLKTWFEEMKPLQRVRMVEFFENQILIGFPEGYSESRLRKFFHSKDLETL